MGGIKYLDKTLLRRQIMNVCQAHANTAMRHGGAKWCFNCIGAVLLCVCNPANAASTSLYTSVKEGECKKPSAAIRAFYESRGLTVEECDAVKGWRLFSVASDERSWFELTRDGNLWSSDEQVVQRNQFGYFPNIGADKVEWIITSAGTPSAFIFRIAAQSSERTDKNPTRLFVVGFNGDTPYFCGVAKSNEEARALAGKTGSCSTALRLERLPK